MASSKRSATGAKRRDEAGVVVRDFHPERGVAVLEFNRHRLRYTREKSAQQVYAMADYLRARGGFRDGPADGRGAGRAPQPPDRLEAGDRASQRGELPASQLLSHLAVVVQELEGFLDPDVIPDWLLTEQITLAGRTPVNALRNGQLAEVLQAANATEHGAYV